MVVDVSVHPVQAVRTGLSVCTRVLTVISAICPVASMEPRRRQFSVSSVDLIMPPTRRSTMGDRAFAVARPPAWNSLPFPDAIRRSS